MSYIHGAREEDGNGVVGFARMNNIHTSEIAFSQSWRTQELDQVLQSYSASASMQLGASNNKGFLATADELVGYWPISRITMHHPYGKCHR